MKTFFGRERELADLASELDLVGRSGRARFVWLHGRRRVGKSRLAQELCDSSAVSYCFYQAPRRGREDALADFVEAARESSLPAAEAFDGASFGSWPAALRAAVQGLTPADPAILVIDELPYLCEMDAGFAADLQRAWDRTLQNAAVLLICIGSDVRMMDVLMGERSPLHGRPTREMRIAPLVPSAVGEITGAANAAEALDRYLVVGGIPALAASWERGATMRDFLTAALRDDQTSFVTSALRILASEFEGHLQAGRVIEAIGCGESSHSRIQARSAVKGNTLTAALDMLIQAKRLVSRELPYAAPPGKTAAKYTISDPYLRFWLRFVGSHIDELARGRGDLLIERVMRDWSTFRGRAIEPLIREALERLLADPTLSGHLGGARRVGAWWRRDHSIEVDLVGGDGEQPDSVAFIGSIKWREGESFSRGDVHDLARHRAAVPGAQAAKLVVVSRVRESQQLDVDAIFGPEEVLAAWGV